MPKVKSVFFGVSPASYDNGRTPSCAINADNLVVEVHQGESQNTLNYRIGKVDGVQLTWLPKFQNQGSFGDGNNPSVALNKDDVVVVLHDTGSKLKYFVGKVNDNKITFSTDDVEVPGQTSSSSSNPSVALNQDGLVVEVHEDNSKIYWRRGKLEGQTLTWQTGPQQLLAANGHRPSVSINKTGLAVVVYEFSNRLSYSIGQFNPNGTEPWTEPVRYDTGIRPSVALTDEKHVYEIHQLVPVQKSSISPGNSEVLKE